MSKSLRFPIAKVVVPVCLLVSAFATPNPVRSLSFTATGQFRYTNQSSGFSPIRRAQVSIFINGATTPAASGLTDDSGNFSIPVTGAPNSFNAVAFVIARKSDSKISVTDSNTNQTLREPSISKFCNSCSTLAFGTTDVSNTDRKKGFFIFDTLGVTTLVALAAAPTSWTPNTNVTVTYPAGATYYLSPTIYIVGADGYAASPIIHEYGHAAMDMVYGFYPSVIGCNPHTFGAFSSLSS